MSAAVYVVRPATEPEVEISFHCVACDKDVLATESDSHAKNKHKADTVRIFQTETGYQIWQSEQNQGVN